MLYNLGERIKKARLDIGLTQKDVAKKLQCTEIMISRYELGISQVSTVQLARIADILNKPISYFFNENQYSDSIVSTSDSTAICSDAVSLANSNIPINDSTTSIKNVFIFDLDETLVDGRGFCGETVARVITNNFTSVDFQEVVRMHDEFRGHTMHDMYSYITHVLKLEMDGISIEDLLLEDRKIQEENIDKIIIFEGVVEILEFLKNNEKKLYICTNRTVKLLDSILNANGIKDYFDEVISCVDAGYKKPNPYCLIDLMNRNKFKRDECIYFGDSEVDSQFAENAEIEHIIFDQYLNNKNLFKKLVNMFVSE